MTAIVTNDAIREAIVAGHRVWTIAVQIGRVDGAWDPDLAVWHLEHSRQDLYRTAGIETLLTREELDARYEYREEGPYSRDWDEDEDGERVLVPLERADYCGYILSLYPRRRPLPGAVYVARQPIEGDEFTIGGLQRAFRALVDAHGDWPKELRLNPRHVDDYREALLDMASEDTRDYYRHYATEDPRLEFQGCLLSPFPRAPLLTLLAVYPLPGIGA